MAKLVLKFEGSVLKEYPLQKGSVTIGRASTNDIVIDNLGVSGHHAKLILEEDHFVVEDMNSLNGTFLNQQRVRRSTLKSGDEILIGKHTLAYVEEGSALDITAPQVEKTQKIQLGADETVVLDTKQRREMLAKATSIATEGSSPAAKEKVGCLIVLDGKSEQREYILTSKLCVIGKDSMATVKLKGWFSPKVASIINRRDTHYEIAPSDKAGATKVNSEVLTAVRKLNEGDLIQVGSLKLQFYFRE